MGRRLDLLIGHSSDDARYAGDVDNTPWMVSAILIPVPTNQHSIFTPGEIVTHLKIVVKASVSVLHRTVYYSLRSAGYRLMLVEGHKQAFC